jgi:uncharacterized protein YndB with AHSA1/START domain
MPVRKDPSGQRAVEAEVVVPGTPDEVWAAIATGPGMSAWFVPSTSEERVGGIATNNFGPGMESIATIREWNPPRSFVAETEEEPGRVATEWTVEARGGGTCVVRVVHRWFASTDDWDDQFEGHTYGWLAFFRVLKLYLTHFRGQQSSAFQLSAVSSSALPEVWQAVINSLAISDDEPGIRVTPSAAGVVDRRTDDAHPELLLRLNGPAPGIAHLFAMSMGPQTMVSVRVYLYGDQAADTAEVAKQSWDSWLSKTFPQTTECQ